MGSFCPRYTRSELKKYRGVIFYDSKKWCKIWIDPDLLVWKMASGIGWTIIRALKYLKVCTLMGSFCPKNVMFQLENFSWIMCHDTEGWCKGKLTHGLKNDIRNLINFHVSSRKSENLHFDWIFLSKAYNDLDEKIQKIYVSWHWRVVQSFKKNWLLVPKMTWRI